MKDQQVRRQEMAEALYTTYQQRLPGHTSHPWATLNPGMQQVWCEVAEEAMAVVTDQFKEALAEGPRDLGTEAMLATLLRQR